MMANDRSIDEDTLFEPERLAARAFDWDQIDRGHSSGRAATSLQHRRRIHGRNQDYASINRKSLAPQEPSIHGSRPRLNDFCIEALEEALARYGTPEIFNIDQGSQFTSTEFIKVLAAGEIKISMDGKGAWRDYVLVERL